MIRVAQVEHIKYLHKVKHWSQRKIARELGISRNTVKKVLEEDYKPGYHRSKEHSCPVTNAIRSVVEKWLEDDKTSPKKQRHTAKRIFTRLIEQHEYNGSYSTVKRLVRELKQTSKEVYIPLEFDPGTLVQADWGQAYAVMNGVKIQVNLFCMRWAHSKSCFVMAFPFEKQEAFFEGHRQAFEFFGCVPQTVLYDNLKTAVRKVLEGKNRIEQEQFLRLRAHYVFKSDFCNVAKGNEKGLVENLVGYCRRNFLVPLPEVESFAELNDLLRIRCELYNGEEKWDPKRWKAEVAAALPLPNWPFECCTHLSVKSNSLSTIMMDTNKYSVPSRYANGLPLSVKAFVDRIEVSYKDKIIATHPRILGRGQERYVLEHYLDVLARKPGALHNAKPVRQHNFPPPLQVLFNRIGVGDAAARREFIKILLLAREYGEDRLAQAVGEALSLGLSDCDWIKNRLELAKTNRISSVPKQIPQVTVAKTSLNDFNLLLKKGGETHDDATRISPARGLS